MHYRDKEGETGSDGGDSGSQNGGGDSGSQNGGGDSGSQSGGGGGDVVQGN